MKKVSNIKALKKELKEKEKLKKEKEKLKNLKDKENERKEKLRIKMEKRLGRKDDKLETVKVAVSQKRESEAVEKDDKLNKFNVSRRGLKNKIMNFFFSKRTRWVINMELTNGMHRSFTLQTSKDSFKHSGDTYIIDSELKYYNVDSACFCLDYHQGLSIPIRRVIPVANIKKAIEASGLTEVENATNPSTLNNFIVSKVAEGVMKGQQIDHFFKQLRLLLIITTIASLLHLFLFAQKTGMLEKVTGSLGF